MSQQIKIIRNLSVPNLVTDLENVLTDICNIIELKLNDANLLAMTTSGSPDKKRHSINDLDDVDTSGVEDGDVLQWNESTKQWEDGSLTLNDLDDVDTSGVEDGDVLQWNESTKQWEANKSAGGRQPLTENVEITVGSGGDFSTINEALEYAVATYYPVFLNIADVPQYLFDGYITTYVYTGNVPRVTVRLLAGFEMNEQVFVESLDLSWITIVGDDDETLIKLSAFTIGVPAFEKPMTSESYTRLDYPAFIALNGAFLPIIKQLFRMEDDSEIYTDNKHGIVATINSKAIIMEGCGVINAGGFAIHANENSVINANGAIANTTGNYNSCNIYANNSSIINANYANTSGSSYSRICICAKNNSIINANYAEAAECGYGILARYGSKINAQFATILHPYFGVYAFNNSVINADYVYMPNSEFYGIGAEENSKVNAYGANVSGSNRGVLANRNSTVNVGGANISNTSTGIEADNGSTVFALDANVNYASVYGLNVQHGSTVNAQYIRINDTGQRAVFVDTGSTVYADNSQMQRAGVYGIYATGGSKVVAYKVNASGAGTSGIYADKASTVIAQEANVSGSGTYGVYANNGSKVDIYKANASGAGTSGIYADRASSVTAQEVNISNSRNYGVYANHGSKVDAYKVVTTGVVGTVFNVFDNSFINASGTTGSTNITRNVITSNGIILRW